MKSSRWLGLACALALAGPPFWLLACGGGSTPEGTPEAGPGSDGATGSDAYPRRDVAQGTDGRNPGDSGPDRKADAEDAPGESAADAAAGTGTCTGDAGAGDSCYAITCTTTVHSLQENRDRLVADLAKRKGSASCAFWATLNQAERYIFLMDTVYLGAPASLVHPPGSSEMDTALDHAVAMYSINGPEAGQGVLANGLGGNDFNRIYLGFDTLAQCVMRNFAIANPSHESGYNEWVKSDDLAGPHAPFTERDMIKWWKVFPPDLQSQGPQFHFWAKDSDFTQSGLDARCGVFDVTDPSVTELTIAFDFDHDSNPLGTYGKEGPSMGGFGWQIVDQFVGIAADWTYMPSGCPTTAPVNTSTTGGGTFAGMGPSAPGLVDGGTCP
jgi:hypothetical protein